MPPRAPLTDQVIARSLVGAGRAVSLFRGIRPTLRGEYSSMPGNELQTFLEVWDLEAKKTVVLLKALPPTQYDFRPDAGGRSLGELAWHLAEGDAYMSYGIEAGKFDQGMKPPNIERPRTVEGLAPGYERIHKEAVPRIRKLKAE